MASRKRRARQQALDEAELRYAPERTQLKAILGDLVDTRDSEVRSARQGGKMLARSVKRSVAPLKKSYDESIEQSRAVQAVLDASNAKLGETGSGLREALKAGSGTVDQILAGQRARAVGELTDRRTGAIAGAVAEARNARAAYRSDRAKVLDQLKSNASLAGTFASARYGDIRGEQRKDATTRRGQTLSARERQADRTSREKIADVKQQQAEAKERAKVKAKRVEARKERVQRRDFIQNAIENPPPFPPKHPRAGKTPTEAEVISQLIRKGYSQDEINKAIADMRRTIKRPGNARSKTPGQQRPT